MKYGALLLLFLPLLETVFAVDFEYEAENQEIGKARDGKFLSLFNFVTFKNIPCDSNTPGLTGTCMTKDECSGQGGGEAHGNCASGFGVCCVVSLSGCGGTINKNCTYVSNTGYPSNYNTNGACTYTIQRACEGICSWRIDFVRGEFLQPEDTGANSGQCTETTRDRVITTSTSSAGQNIPVLCGTLTGQHMYIDAGRAGAVGSTMGTIALNLGSDGGNRAWRMKISQIECHSKRLPPDGCLQYFTGNSGLISSFNRQGNQMIANLDYTACIRQQEGYCSIIMNAPTFDLAPAADPDAAVFSQDDCNTALNYILNNRNYFCGDEFGNGGQSVRGYILGGQLMDINVRTLAPAAGLADSQGFEIMYHMRSGC